MVTLVLNDGEEITMYTPQLRQYLQIIGESSFDDEEVICEAMLMDEATSFLVNHRNVVLDF